jgi:ketosteroid isomerase-like protein
MPDDGGQRARGVPDRRRATRPPAIYGVTHPVAPRRRLPEDGTLSRNEASMTDEMSTEGTAWQFWDHLGHGRVDDALDLLDDDGLYWVSTYGARDDRPMASMKKFFRRTAEMVPMRFTKRDALVSGDRVALEIESYADTPLGVYNNCYCFIMTVRDGKIVRINEYVDTLHASQVLIPQISRPS